MLRGHLIWCLIHTVLWHLKTRVSLCCCRVPLEGTAGLQSHTDRHMADTHSLIWKHEHAPMCLGRAYASSWRAWPNTQALSFSLKHTHRKSEKMQLKKKLMRHISYIPAQFLAVKAFTTVAQESLTQLHRCWLCNSTWQKWNRSKLWTVVFNEHRLSQSNYWKYAMHLCCYIRHGHVIFQMGLNVLWQVHKMVTACW